MRFVYYIAAFLGGGIFYFCFSWLITSSGRKLKKKRDALGSLPGKTYAEIAAVLGLPDEHRKLIKSRNEICIWSVLGYDLELQINDRGVCTKVIIDQRHVLGEYLRDL